MPEPAVARLGPISLREAAAWIDKNHRHHKAPQGMKFAIAAEVAGETRGVIVVGRPVARGHDPAAVAEITRCCTIGDPNLCTFLYGAAARASEAMGYARIVTYTLESEGGASLRAAGFRHDGLTAGGSWDTPARRRSDKAPIDRKKRWVRDLRPREAVVPTHTDPEIWRLLS